ncbi:hypothetical protein DASC09_038580 [Saccharomycopsis crataegensis]|uniref:Uncharacterized protein n=1 Tax=Saccharomycopsis crataegensis TaxID=43959 RepID=A0AAV5QP22_9ASCO|nr:hypothetical protein DASC09_038580 [Saccharomycopsis crataegensis]
MLCQLSIASLFISMTAAAGHHSHKYALFDEAVEVSKRSSGNDCEFPTDLGLVAVNEKGTGGGWAIAMDQTCKAGSWCPYACPPGYLSAQWDPEATSYTYPQSQYGGLKCNSDGTLSKGFSGKAYCVEGKGTVSAKNTIGKDVAFCQTVLPGNEEMSIPTNVGANNETVLAVPGTDYWAGTAAHYYVNYPGISVEDACTWGSDANPQGNWSPYVAGANQDDSGNTYVKIGWNPIYLDSSFATTEPNFGIRITCDDESKCNGLQCEIDPTDGINTIKGSSSTGAGAANFCVVTAESGNSAKIEVFSTGSSSSSSSTSNKGVKVLNRGVNATSLATSISASATAATNASHITASATASTSTSAGVARFNTNPIQTIAVVLAVVIYQNLF